MVNPGDPEKSIEFSKRGYAIDSSNHLEISRLLTYRYMLLGQNEEAEYYFNEYIIYANKIIELGGEVGTVFMLRYFLASVYAVCRQQRPEPS